MDLQEYDEAYLKKLYEKRDKKYFITDPEELVDERYMTRSFFAFGDFKENVNKKYVISLARSLKEN